MSEYNKMVADLTKPPAAIIASMTETRANILHAMLGINDELLEIYEALEDKDMNNLLEELGDCVFYTEMLGMELGVTLEDVQYELDNFTIPDATKYPTIRKLAGEAVTFAKRIGIYCKDYDNTALKGFYVRVHMLLKEVGKMFTNEIRESFANLFGETLDDAHVRGINAFRLVKEANMQKLLKGDTARYKSGSYSDEQANARADKADNVDHHPV